MVSVADRAAFDNAAKYHPNDLSKLVYFEKYSRWNPTLERRETWIETVDRACAYLRELSDNVLSDDVYSSIKHFILNMKVLPSMRLMAMAGPAARRNNISLYNCAYTPIDSIDSFVEALVISMNGTGFGYSVERDYTKQLPTVRYQTVPTDLTDYHLKTTFVVDDSSEGWADALRTGLTCWFNGYDLDFDYSRIRPAGSILRIKGGRASGPDPLRNMLTFARNTILGAQGRRLTSLEAHDIVGNIALGAVSGGHRRSAMISLYDWDDQEMRHCKDGAFWNSAPWRTTANNSAVLNNPDMDDASIRGHFQSMVEGGNGEPGIFSRIAAQDMRPTRRELGYFGTNPCAEISLLPQQFCNLTELVLTNEDTAATIYEKVVIATIIGTIQSTATNFPGLRSSWKTNCEEERLLGVGFTGQMDCPAFRSSHVMSMCRKMAVEVNAMYARKLNINKSASITCVKPSGSTSLLTNSASGLHTRWAPYYERNIRVMATGALARTLLAQGVPMDPENGQSHDNGNVDTYVVHFPIAAPKGAITRGDRTAIQQMEYWKQCKLNLTEHNPSVTITYRPTETQQVEDWIVDNRSILGGMAFLPHFDEDINLKQMPNREITAQQYHQYKEAMPKIDFSMITDFEHSDQTTAAQEVACSAGLCEM